MENEKLYGSISFNVNVTFSLISCREQVQYLVFCMDAPLNLLQEHQLNMLMVSGEQRTAHTCLQLIKMIVYDADAPGKLTRLI